MKTLDELLSYGNSELIQYILELQDTIELQRETPRKPKHRDLRAKTTAFDSSTTD